MHRTFCILLLCALKFWNRFDVENSVFLFKLWGGGVRLYHFVGAFASCGVHWARDLFVGK